MKIVHICLESTYNEGWTYQDNLLPHYHRLLGHEVDIIAPNAMFSTEGARVFCEPYEKTLEDGSRLHRLRETYLCLRRQVMRNTNVVPLLESIHPDLIFQHGITAPLITKQVRVYAKRHPMVVLFADNHVDASLAGKPNKLSSAFIKRTNKRHLSRYDKVYGVTQSRKDYAVSALGAPADKMGLLIMGGDDEIIARSSNAEAGLAFRKEHGLEPNDFIVVNGGKLEKRKKNAELIDAFLLSRKPKNAKLVLFGSIEKDYKRTLFDKMEGHDSVVYIPWLDQLGINTLFCCADLGVFPAAHSVLWENALCCGLPCLFHSLPGYDHLYWNGNSHYIPGDSVADIKNALELFLNNDDAYRLIKKKAKDNARLYSYSTIAKQVIDDYELVLSARKREAER